MAEAEAELNAENDPPVEEERKPIVEKVKKETTEADDYEINYKNKYRNLKRKLNSLLYEQECFHEELRKAQRKCLRVSRDKSFLLDRLLQYEQPDISSDEYSTDSSSGDDDYNFDEDIPKTKASTSKKNSKTKKKHTADATSKKSSGKTTARNTDKIRCKHMENSKQCTKLFSKRLASDLCQTHRQETNKNNKTLSDTSANPPAADSTPKTTAQPRKPPTGGKDIGQIREAMEAASKVEGEMLSSENEMEDDLVIDLPH